MATGACQAGYGATLAGTAPDASSSSRPARLPASAASADEGSAKDFSAKKNVFAFLRSSTLPLRDSKGDCAWLGKQRGLRSLGALVRKVYAEADGERSAKCTLDRESGEMWRCDVSLQGGHGEREWGLYLKFTIGKTDNKILGLECAAAG